MPARRVRFDRSVAAYSPPGVEAAHTSPPGARTILIGYDGSAYADHAIDEAARMFPGAGAVAETAAKATAGADRAARVSNTVVQHCAKPVLVVHATPDGNSE
jgi:hypothetical protein